MKRISDETRDKIIKMSENGSTIGDIAYELGVSRSTVVNIRREKGFVSDYNKGGVVSRTIPKVMLTSKEEKPGNCEEAVYTVLNNKTVELVGIKTGYLYTASSKGDSMRIKTGYSDDIQIDYKDLVDFANEIFEIVEAVSKMKSDVFSI